MNRAASPRRPPRFCSAYITCASVSLRDVLPQDFDSYSPEVQKLICTADHLGTLMQYNTSGFLSNQRIHRGQTGNLESWENFVSICLEAQLFFV